jgi:hypothetical protein
MNRNQDRVAEYSKYKDLGGLGEWDRGILNIKLNYWNQFHDEIAKLLELGDLIWRGQRCDWKLKSKFDRIVRGNRKAKLEEHKNSFMRAIRGRRGNNPPQLNKEEDIWSLGQHYGLATPLLDWTESPFVAAYFAFRKEAMSTLQNTMVTSILEGQNNDNPRNPILDNAPSRFIYGLSKDIKRWGPAKSKGSRPFDQFVKFVEPFSDENPRLLNQRGLFTLPMSQEIDIENTVQKCYAKDNKRAKKRIIFVKIKLFEIEREKCLRNLNTMNINHATLFPDLMGAAEYCNVKLEIEGYS